MFYESSSVLDVDSGYQPSVTLEDSSDDDESGRMSGSHVPPIIHYSRGSHSLDHGGIPGAESVRRDGAVLVPQQSTVFGSIQQV